MLCDLHLLILTRQTVRARGGTAPLHSVKRSNVVPDIIVLTNHRPPSDGGDSDGGADLLRLQKKKKKRK